MSKGDSPRPVDRDKWENCCLADKMVKLWPRDKDGNLIYSNNNNKLTYIGHMHNLRVLHATGQQCRIDDNSIKYLTNLTELNIYDNNNITNINYIVNIPSLRKLIFRIGSIIDRSNNLYGRTNINYIILKCEH